MPSSRRRRRQGVVNDEARWANAIEHKLKKGMMLQMVGLKSPTGTVFARLLIDMDDVDFSLKDDDDGHVLCQIVHAILQQNNNNNKLYPTPHELIQLGAVWCLEQPQTGESSSPSQPSINDNNNRRQSTNPIWKRVMRIDHRQASLWSECTFRIHCRPGRFLNDWKVEDNVVMRCDDLFWVVNKPGGLPAHATVDNAIENALALFQTQFYPAYASLPQRLDTETSGLLIVATDKAAATYLSKLLEQKTTLTSSPHGAMAISPSTHNENKKLANSISTKSWITKYYRCLVGIDSLERYNQLKRRQSTLVTHFLDAQSPAPKRFVSETSNILDSDKMDGGSTKWLECRLRLILVGEPLDANSDLLKTATATHRYIAEIEVELLTGRTHQIRGQMAALGFPIVGDPLYSNNIGLSEAKEQQRCRPSTEGMALQCCAMEFPKPEWHQNRLRPSEEEAVSLKLETAWWTQFII